jgi:hypothetical protein
MKSPSPSSSNEHPILVDYIGGPLDGERLLGETEEERRIMGYNVVMTGITSGGPSGTIQAGQFVHVYLRFSGIEGATTLFGYAGARLNNENVRMKPSSEEIRQAALVLELELDGGSGDAGT